MKVYYIRLSFLLSLSMQCNALCRTSLSFFHFILISEAGGTDDDTTNDAIGTLGMNEWKKENITTRLYACIPNTHRHTMTVIGIPSLSKAKDRQRKQIYKQSNERLVPRSLYSSLLSVGGQKSRSFILRRNIRNTWATTTPPHVP